MDPNTSKDPEMVKAMMQRKKELMQKSFPEGLTFEDIKPYVSMYKGEDGKTVYDVLNKDGESDKKFADSKAAMAYLSQNFSRLKEVSNNTEAEAEAQEEAEEINTELDRIKELANLS